MACCAFAVFLLSQLLLPFRTVARALGITSDATRPDPAVLWRPGLLAPAPATRRSRRLLLGTFLLVDGVLLALLVQAGPRAGTPLPASAVPGAAEIEILLHRSFCGNNMGRI